MDGRWRALDNVFVERLWRSVKYEEVYLKDYGTVAEAEAGIRRYFEFYNWEHLHQSLGYRTPYEVHYANERATAGAGLSHPLPTVPVLEARGPWTRRGKVQRAGPRL